MSDDFIPETQSSGSLEPPRRLPPTAIGVETPEPAPEPSPRHHSASIPSPAEVLGPVLRAAVGAVRQVVGVLTRR